MKTLRLALLGFGNAGQAFVQMLSKKHGEICQKYDTDVRISAVATGRHGSVVNAEGMTPADVLKMFQENGQFPDAVTALEIVTTAAYDVLVELTPLNIRTGQPAIDHIRGAFARGKHVVTANKGPIAWAYDELCRTAQEKGVCFFHETTVMDGTPVFNLYDETLPLTEVTEVSGILNTTTNYILEELAKGRGYDDILAEGRRLGFVEADASMDIEGYDAAAKITALANVLMHAHLTPDQVERKGIEDITPQDIQAAADRGKVIKLLCRAWRENGIVRTRVQPAEVPLTALEATIDATSSLVSITTDLMGKLSVVEHNPLIQQTAYGVFGDVLRVIKSTY